MAGIALVLQETWNVALPGDIAVRCEATDAQGGYQIFGLEGLAYGVVEAAPAYEPEATNGPSAALIQTIVEARVGDAVYENAGAEA